MGLEIVSGITDAQVAAAVAAEAVARDAAIAAAEQDQLASISWNATISATSSFPVFTAQQPTRLLSASLVVWNSALAASDTNYFTVDVGRNRANSRVAVATKTTRVTGGEAIATRTDWNFDAATWNAANAELAKGDTAEFVFTLTGTASLVAPVTMTIRYELV